MELLTENYKCYQNYNWNDKCGILKIELTLVGRHHRNSEHKNRDLFSKSLEIRNPPYIMALHIIPFNSYGSGELW